MPSVELYYQGLSKNLSDMLSDIEIVHPIENWNYYLRK